MYQTESNEKIGKYVGKLISGKFDSDRRFATEYLKARYGIKKPSSEEIQKMANRICQIKQGNKGIQITDLPIFAHLLEVSVDAILSCGKEQKPVSARMTNYFVAHSDDEEVWKEYVARQDKLILNYDEYGKSVIDYALEFRNYRFLKYLTDNGLIWFVDEKHQDYWGTFGAGTSIQRRLPGETDILDVMMKQSDDLRTSFIALALENKEFDDLDKLKAREIPTMYEARCFQRTPLDFEKYYNLQLMDAILEADDEVLVYFSEAFDIKANDGFTYTYTFPYLDKLINMAIKKGRKAAALMLENAIKHNGNTRDKVRKIAQDRAKAMKKIYACAKKSDIVGFVMEDYHFYDTNNTVSFHTSVTSTKGLQGLFTNVISVSASSKDAYIAKLIGELNKTYDMIKTYEYKEESE